jgi:hypothetical protein
MMVVIPVVAYVELYWLLYYGAYVHLHDDMCNPVKYMVVCGMRCGGLILAINS